MSIFTQQGLKSYWKWKNWNTISEFNTKKNVIQEVKESKAFFRSSINKKPGITLKKERVSQVIDIIIRKNRATLNNI